MLLAISAFTTACGQKKSEPTPDPTPAPEVNGKDPIANDSGLPTEVVYNNEPSIMIHYQRYKGSYQPWGLWLWSEGLEGGEYKFNYADDYGVIAYYPLATFNNPKSLGFIVKQLFSYAGDGVWKKDDIDNDRFMDIDMLRMDDHKIYNVYLSNTASNVYTDPARTKVMKAVKYCEFENSTTIKLEANDKIQSLVVKKNGSEITPKSKSGDKVVTIVLNETADVADIFSVEITFEEDMKCEKPVSIRKLYDAAFDAKYNYDGELGAIYSETQTTFKVWSPVSKSIKLRIYDNGTPTSVDAVKGNDVFEEYEMSKGEKGVFSKTLDGDLEGKYYTYFVTNTSYPTGQEVVDPYAYSAGVSGKRGMIVDFSKTNPDGWKDVDYLTYDRKELTVYETHIAELTCADTWGGTAANAKLFKGFYETGTKYTNGGKTVKTGFDHIKELGVNAVQIIPFFDQANDETNMTFNWGYNPLNYNVVEGGYSSNPYDGYVRIRELKQLIKSYHDEGITIIMDVVYNHVNGLSGCQFDVLMPYYYFRYNKDGQASNGSGCGNETASDKYMFRKFMIDSTSFWTREYKLGGYRFDLMGVHDVDTMNLLTAANKKINPNIVIYGEPWTGGTISMPNGYTSASQAAAGSYVGYGQFNDHFRDSLISGGMTADYSRRWATQTKWVVDPSSVANGMKGITMTGVGPDKTVSYVTCHDNYTLHDRARVADIANTDIAPKDYETEETLEKINALCMSVVFTSQGTTFMLAGEEMLRTKIVYDTEGNPVMATNKDGESLGVYEVSGNSYNSCYKTNELNYQWKIDHPQLFEIYQKLIALKQSADGLHKADPNTVTVEGDGNVIKAVFSKGNQTVEVYHCNGAAKKNQAGDALTPYVVNTTGSTLYLDTLGTAFNSSSMTLKPFETLILIK